MPAKFYEQDISSKLTNKRKLSAFLDGIIKKHIKKLKKVTISYIFCNDDYLLSINRQFLKHNTLTDIITFDLSENKDELEAEIYISIDRVQENADKFNVAYQNELHRVIFHGVLHLCGFKDKSSADRLKMQQMENKCLKEYFKS